jgi:hypothetical protein
MHGLKRRLGLLEQKVLKQSVVRPLVIVRHPGETWEEAERNARAAAGIDPNFGSRPGETLAVIRLTIL